MIDRVSDTITNWGIKDGYFTVEEAEDFRFKLKYYQSHQYFAFNSPVYFNVGLHDKPQTSACFILKIEDNMESIFDIAKIESMIFKNGSGSGINMSALRSSKEPVSGGGYASGPISFLRAHDTVAGVIKSGGTLRRSAKLVCLNIDHPDIEDFITCKVRDEEKLNILRNNGITARPGYDLSDEVFYQNTNISVRLNNEFMKAVENDDVFWTKYIKTGEKCNKYKARDLLWKIAENAWSHGDPGIQLDDTFNDWNTVAKSERINATNPCGEFSFIDNSSCNLASINLLKFFENNYFDYKTLRDVVETMIIAQDILIDNSSYPTEEIKNNSIDYRPIGAGYTNFGATLMYLGLPYDSKEGRNIAAALTALLTGIAYQTSNLLATKLGAFKHFKKNKNSFYGVLRKHDNAVIKLDRTIPTIQIMDLVKDVWNDIYSIVSNDGLFRNATVSLLAPTGTISSLMLAATTGVEPEFALVRYKTLSGSEGATLKYVNPIIEQTLKNLNYREPDINSIIEHIEEYGSVESCTLIKDEHIPIFDTSLAPKDCNRVIDYMGHVKMCAAIQPFLSMGMSKTINMPNNCTVEDVYNLFIQAWKLGLKGITIYRDGSKTFQVLNVDNKKVETEVKQENKQENKQLKILRKIFDPIFKQKNIPKRDKDGRKKLPDVRPGLIRKFRIGSDEGYLIEGFYPDTGEWGEMFLEISKEGSVISGFADSWATDFSISIQSGNNLKTHLKKGMFKKFDPSGFTNDPDIRSCTSIVDYVCKRIGMDALSFDDRKELGLLKPDETTNKDENYNDIIYNEVANNVQFCPECGGSLRLLGTCFTCFNCAWNSGSCG
jgi:ribonucleoside-diphosphate reductase alpha chain